MKNINVLYTTDKKYLNYMLVSIYSLLESNKDIDIIFHIICDGFATSDYKRISNIIDKFDNANVYFYDFKPIKELVIKYDIPKWKDTYIANARLFFNDYIKDIPNLLYLDSDTIVVDSIKNLDNYDGAINMVLDTMPKNHIEELNENIKSYYNSGILWINMDKWNKSDCYSKIIKSLENKVFYTFPDQDLINISLKDNIEKLPPNYNLFATDAYFDINFLYRYYKSANISRYSKEELKDAKENPIILHSTDFYTYKAWDKNSFHPYKKYYEEYFKKMDLDLEDNDIKVPNELLFKSYLYLKLLCPEKIKSKIKQYIRK